MARIVPSEDGTPAATEAGAGHFGDAAIDGPFRDMLEPVRNGLGELNDRSLEAGAGRAPRPATTCSQEVVHVKINVVTVLGIILVLVGVLALLGLGIPSETAEISVGGLEATVEEERTLPPLVSVALVIAGLVAVILGHRR